MALHTERDPDSLKGVAAAYIEILGAKRAAAIAGVSLSMMYTFANPSTGSEIHDLDRLRDLDRACADAGQAPPFLGYWMRTIGGAAGTVPRLELATLELNAAVGETSNAVFEAMSPQSPGGTAVTRREAVSIKNTTKRVRDFCDHIDRAADTASGLREVVGG